MGMAKNGKEYGLFSSVSAFLRNTSTYRNRTLRSVQIERRNEFIVDHERSDIQRSVSIGYLVSSNTPSYYKYRSV